MSSDVDLIEMLEQDHRRIDDLAERLDAVEDGDEIRALYRQIVDALRAHEAIEHEILFPAFGAMLAEGGDETLHDRLGEHEELNCLLDEMVGFQSDDFAFVKRASALLLDLEGHFAREEESVFALMRERLSDDERRELGRRALERGDAVGS